MTQFPKHLVDIESLSRENILSILAAAEKYLVKHNSFYKYESSALLKNKTVFNIFFEPSTRTRSAFEVAAKNLSANVINLYLEFSSEKKGESLSDTIATIKAMQPDYLVARHKESGIAKYIAELCGEDVCMINAGDGTNAHPTQALLDMMTIAKHKTELDKLADTKIVIIGDILHSRVAKSQITALQKLGANNIHLVGPKTLLPQDNNYSGSNITIHTELKPAIKDADIVSTLRLQKERIQHTLIVDEDAYFNSYGVTKDILKLAKPDAIVMHPGPINRNVEISSEVADSKQAVILNQVNYGVAVRMAVFELFSPV